MVARPGGRRMEAVSVAWIPGASFLVFIAAFVVYVLTSRPERNEQSAPSPHPSGATHLPTLARAHCGVPAEYCISVFVPAFVNYPFEVRIFFGDSALGTCDRDHSIGPWRSLGDYNSPEWPLRDKGYPQPQARGGRIDLHREEREPRIGLELQYDTGVFEGLRTEATVKLEEGSGVVCSLWLKPMKEGESSLTLVMRPRRPNDGGDSSIVGSEPLITIPLPVKVTEFPIRLR